jgi:hypothetical protein
MAILAVETMSLALALLSGVMYGVSGQHAWQVILWVAAIMLLLPSALAAFFFVFGPSFLPAAILMLLAAMFSLGARQTTGVSDVDHQPLMPPSDMAAPRRRLRLILGIALALLGEAAIIFLLPVSWLASWVALLLARAISNIGATLLIRSPLSALVVPAGVWLCAMAALICNGLVRGGFTAAIFWWGALKFTGIFIVIAVSPALVGVGIGAPLTRWLPGASV